MEAYLLGEFSYKLCGAPGKGGWGPGGSQSPCSPVPDLGGGSIIYPNPIPPDKTSSS